MKLYTKLQWSWFNAQDSVIVQVQSATASDYNVVSCRSSNARQLTSKQHGEDGEYLLGVGDCGHVAEADAGKYSECEVEWSDITRAQIRTAVWVVS